MRATSTWKRWLALLLVAWAGLAGSRAAAACACPHDAGVESQAPDACDAPCDGACSCHLLIATWQAPAALSVSRRPESGIVNGFLPPGDPCVRVIFSPPRA